MYTSVVRHHCRKKKFSTVYTAYIYNNRTVAILSMNYVSFRSLWMWYALLLVGALVVSSCNDQPSPLGSDLITDTLRTVVITSDTTRLLDSAYAGNIVIPISNGGDKANTNIFLVGNTPTAKATTFIRFDLVPDSVATLTEQEIISASLKLHPLRYAFGDTIGNQLSFDVVHINKVWAPSITKDTLAGTNFFGDKVASFSESIVFKDTVPPLFINLSDKATIHRWIFTDSLKYGLALVPLSGSQVIRQFSTVGIGQLERATTSIELVYKRTGSTSVDTVYVQSAYINTIIESNTPLPEKKLVVQGGVVSRSRLLFDISSIPPLATIHRAELALTWDSASSAFGNSGVPTTVSLRFATGDSLTSADAAYAIGTRKANSTAYVFPNIGTALERWLRGTKNYGLILHTEAGPEIRQLDRMVFYGLRDIDAAKRPRLTIVYSVKPDTKGQ